ncbi:MAG: hypothetical protein KDE51_26080, partial [Anaerolineales bacterium]|nr:hypothetical protein [Anaerolineales bacterium]
VVNERGIALTPFSYKRLDSLSGYEAGMPSPGFYDHVWRSGQSPTAEPIHRPLLAQVAQMLRERKQVVSAADLIAVEMMAQSLAQLRGHARVWRRDLIDGIIGALIKEEIAFGLPHPFLAAVYELFRGDTRGKLAEGTSLPPLVLQLQELLRTHDLEPANEVRTVKLDLFQKPDLIKSRILHQIEVLRLPGYTRVGSSDIVRGEQTLREVWRIEWSPEFEAACIEAAIYGPVLDDAARARLHERLTEMENPNAAVAAGILVDAAQIGLPDNATEFRPFYRALYDVIVQDGDFFNVAYALRNLLYLYRFDEVLGTLRHANIGRLLVTAFQRALWLLESLGAVTGRDEALLGSLRALLETYERCGAMLNIGHEDFCETFSRIGEDQGQTPLLRGAVTGVLWSLAAADGEAVTKQLRSFAAPERLGDFLTGLFALGREVVQRRPDLLETIDDFLLGYDEQSFWEALPSLRLAFTTFTPREKHDIANQLFVDEAAVLEQLPDLEVTIEQAAEVLAFEDALFAELRKYGLGDN